MLIKNRQCQDIFEFITITKFDREIELVTELDHQTHVSVTFAQVPPRLQINHVVWDISFLIKKSGWHLLDLNKSSQTQYHNEKISRILRIVISAIELFLKNQNQPRFCLINTVDPRLQKIFDRSINRSISKFGYQKVTREYLVDQILKDFESTQQLNKLYSVQTIQEYIANDAVYFEKIQNA
jgi:hypothetical protein